MAAFRPDPKPEKRLPKSKQRINPKGDQKKELDKIYKILRLKKLSETPDCEAKLGGCTVKAEEIHHNAGRVQWRYVYLPWFLSICRSCHDFATENSEQAIELGISLSLYTKKPLDADDYLNLENIKS